MTHFKCIRKTLIFCLLITGIVASTAVQGYAEGTTPVVPDTHESSDGSEGVISAPDGGVPTDLTPAEKVSTNPSEGIIPGNVTQHPKVVQFQCLASDPNCLIAWSININPNVAQARALNLCITASPFSFCYARGCIPLP